MLDICCIELKNGGTATVYSTVDSRLAYKLSVVKVKNDISLACNKGFSVLARLQVCGKHALGSSSGLQRQAGDSK